jgi:hypothetical protein
MFRIGSYNTIVVKRKRLRSLCKPRLRSPRRQHRRRRWLRHRLLLITR